MKFLIAFVAVAIVYYFIDKNKKKKQQEEAAENLEREKKAEQHKKVRTDEKLAKLEVLTKHVQEINSINVSAVADDVKAFVVENETAITTLGGEAKLFEFLKLDTFLSDYRQKIVKDIEYISSNYSQSEIEWAIKDYGNQDPLLKAMDNLNDISKNIAGRQGTSTNAKIELLFKNWTKT